MHQNNTQDMLSSFIVLLIIYLWGVQFASRMLEENVFHSLFTMPVSKGLSLFISFLSAQRSLILDIKNTLSLVYLRVI